MTSAYVLVVAILLLGGVIAALGDRLGSKVGKARLRLFKLRPRQTAVLVTILTGIVIAASTLGILFATSKSLRQGIFRLDEILEKRRDALKELARANQEKNQVEKELAQAQVQQAEARKSLDQINQKFQQAQAQLKEISGQAADLRSEIESLLSERRQLFQQREQLTAQIGQLQTQTTQLRSRVTQLQAQTTQLRSQVTQLQAQVEQRNQELAEREQEIAAQERMLQESETRLQQIERQRSALQSEISERDEVIAQLDQAIATRDEELKARQTRLEEVEQQLAFLQKEVEVLAQEYQALRQKDIALVRNQVLSFGVFRVVDPSATRQVVDQLLQEANRTAIQATRPGNGVGTEQVIQITKAQVEQLIDQIEDDQDYVVRILSAGNYVRGERQVRVFADVAPNQEIFDAGEVIAAVSIEPSTMTQEELQQRLDLLLAASQFRARRSGVLGEIQVEDGRIATLIRFIEQLNQSQQSLEQIKAVVSETTYTAGPLKLRLVAMRDGEVLFST